MSWALAIIMLELVLFLIFLNRKSKLGTRITEYLMKRQRILRVQSMEEVDERIDEICRRVERADKRQREGKRH